jgi:hypothetical protein
MQIEREVILSSADKNSKIPILHEYKKQRPKSASATAIAPDGPNKQFAWTEDKKAPGLTLVSVQKVLNNFNCNCETEESEDNFVTISFFKLFTWY